MATPYVGEIRMFAGTFAPIGWALCNGATLQISQNQVLFVLIGNLYGGDGVTTFAVPDLRGRVNISQGQGTALSPYVLGQAYGTEMVTLTTATMPAHNHPLNAVNTAAVNAAPTPNNTMTVAITQGGNVCYATTSQNPTIVQLNPTDVAAGGGGQPHTNIMPVVAVNYIIATQGIFPSFS